jgi:hypothetical protein
MSIRRLTRCLACSVLALPLTAGCEVLQPSRPVAILARDAETKQQIPGAEIRISYPAIDPNYPVSPSVGTAGANGVAQLTARTSEEAGILLEGAAKGYLPDLQTVPVTAVRAIPPAHLFEAVDQRPVSFTLEMYAEPRPTIELVVPPLYRGPVQVAVQVQETVPCQPGQRCFSHVVPESGIVQVMGPAILRRVSSSDFIIKFADGTPLSRNAAGSDLGFWWVKSEGGSEYFQVGTKSDYEAYRRSLLQQGGGRQAAGGTGDGHGRHGHRSSPSSTDASGTTSP